MLAARACSTPSSADIITTMDSLDCSHASASSVFVGFPCETPQLLSHPLSCSGSQAPCVFDATDLVSDNKVPIPCLHVLPPREPSAHASAASLASSDDEVLILRFSPRSAVVVCATITVSEDEVLILHSLLFVPPLLPITLFALLSMADSDALLLLCTHHAPQACGCGGCPLGSGEYLFATSSSEYCPPHPCDSDGLCVILMMTILFRSIVTFPPFLHPLPVLQAGGGHGHCPPTILVNIRQYVSLFIYACIIIIIQMQSAPTNATWPCMAG
jgi:hypothetical protein